MTGINRINPNPNFTPGFNRTINPLRATSTELSKAKAAGKLASESYQASKAAKMVALVFSLATTLLFGGKLAYNSYKQAQEENMGHVKIETGDVNTEQPVNVHPSLTAQYGEI